MTCGIMVISISFGNFGIEEPESEGACLLIEPEALKHMVLPPSLQELHPLEEIRKSATMERSSIFIVFSNRVILIPSHVKQFLH